MELPPVLNGYIPPSFKGYSLPNSPKIAYFDGPKQSSFFVPPPLAESRIPKIVFQTHIPPPPPLPPPIMNNNLRLIGTPIVEPHVKSPIRCSKENNSFVVVIDTNIYIHKMSDVWRIIDSQSFKSYKIGIPWKVHNELDGLKKHHDLQTAKSARDAAKKINYILTYLNQRVHFQDRFEYHRAKDLFAIENPDDAILQSILQMENSTEEVYLHTNDVILKNKALCLGLKLFEF